MFRNRHSREGGNLVVDLAWYGVNVTSFLPYFSKQNNLSSNRCPTIFNLITSFVLFNEVGIICIHLATEVGLSEK